MVLRTTASLTEPTAAAPKSGKRERKATNSVRETRVYKEHWSKANKRRRREGAKKAAFPCCLKATVPCGRIYGHTFGYFGSSVWADDVFRFLN